MSNSIPPLVCDTPPPIDYFDDQIDDDASGTDSAEEDLSLPSSPSRIVEESRKNKDLPVPDETTMEIPLPVDPKSNTIITIPIDEVNTAKTTNNSGLSNLITDTNRKDNGQTIEVIVFHETQIGHRDEAVKNSATNHNISENQTNEMIETHNDNSYRSESPPSLVLSNDSYAVDVADVESNACDSLPSLKLDSIDEDLPELSSSSVENDIINKIESHGDSEDSPVDDRKETRSPEKTIHNLPVPIEAEDSITKADQSMFDLNESFDDFIEYTETEPNPTRAFETLATTTDIDTTINIPEPCDDDNSFAADFSQFSAFPVAYPTPPLPAKAAKTTTTPTDLSIDDDFNDDTDPHTSENISSNSVVIDRASDLVDDDDFDDFGDFSDFSQIQPTISIAKPTTELTCPNVPLLLDMMFPLLSSEGGEQLLDNENKTRLDSSNMLNKTTVDLKNFDNSKALDHQWLQSMGKNSLVTALGIDPRNILHSGKWNSSMPRFAANLGFNPLEPLKSDSILQPMTVASTKTPEIPAAQFDWNNSGLVNPLDASHAHTLLLDLEQLVVVANLDKIKLDSSSYSAYASCSSFASTNMSSSSPPPPPPPQLPTQPLQLSPIPKLRPSTTTLPPISTKPNLITSNNLYCANVLSSTHNLTVKNNCNNPDVDDEHDGDGYPCTYALFSPSLPSFGGSSYYNHSMVLDNANRFGMFDHYLDIRVQEILHEANAAQNQPARIEPYWNASNTESTANFCETTTTASATAVSSSSFVSPAPAISQPAVQVQLDQLRAAVDNELRDSEEPPAPTSASYVIPGSGSLKETHIFTPSKTPYTIPTQFRSANNVPPSNSSESDFDYKEAAAGIIIDENVVKKEYRDVEYNPEKFASNGSVSLGNDDFSDFQSVVVTAPAPAVLPSSFGILQPIKSSDANIVINWPDPGNVTHLNHELEDFEKFADARPVDTTEHSTTISSHFDRPVIGISPTENMFASLEPIAAADATAAIENISKSVEDEFTDFQSVEHIPAKHFIPTETSASGPLTIQPVAISVPWSNATSGVQPSSKVPPMQFVDSNTSAQSVLKPQTLSSKYDISKSTSSNINWPDPGINSDEMARLEAIFPTPRTSVDNKQQTANARDDDEWSDFVSVPSSSSSSSLAIQPITSIINENIVKQQSDDDDWSEFVSSTPAGPNFPSWNAPSQFSSWQKQQSTIVYGQPPPSPMVEHNQCIVPTIYASTIGKTSTNNNGFASSFNVPPMLDNSNMFLKSSKAPSISLIPDLGFAAPKAAAHLTGRSAARTNNFAKK